MPGGEGYPAEGERRIRATGHRWDVFRQLVFATYGDVCHICLHGGAKTGDHLQSLTEHPELMYALSNCRPAHGCVMAAGPQGTRIATGYCATCSAMAGSRIFCNSIK